MTCEACGKPYRCTAVNDSPAATRCPSCAAQWARELTPIRDALKAADASAGSKAIAHIGEQPPDLGRLVDARNNAPVGKGRSEHDLHRWDEDKEPWEQQKP